MLAFGHMSCGDGRRPDGRRMAASFVPCGMSYILGGVEEKPIGESEDLAAIADEVEAGRGPVAVVRPGHRPVVLVSAEDWQRMDELESAESTAWWRRDAAERRDATGEGAHEGEHEPGIDEEEFRRRFAHLFRRTGAA
jgi:PHD/YefM family antitoxin component YafN of YafNO toxin-antitoxin module